MSNKKILEFNCLSCGLCCKEEGVVIMTDEDVIKASTLLNITSIEFIHKYLKHHEDIGLYIEVLEDKPCVFLKDNKCLINDSKPEQCRTFPYWEEYVDKNGNLLRRKFDRPCPGAKSK